MVEAGTNQRVRSAVRPLVVASTPFPGECLSSLLVRACEANVFAKPAHLLSLLGLHAQASDFVAFSHASAAPDIAKLLGASSEEVENLMHGPVEDHLDRSSVHWFGDSVERRHIEAKERRFAPRSLEKSLHHPALWTIRLLDYCPVTMELLISECPQCGAQLGWRACRSLAECDKCGASLLSAESRTLPQHLHEAARVGAELVSPFAQVRQAALSSLPMPFRHWKPADALEGVLTLGEAQVTLRSSGTDERPGSAELVAEGMLFADDWPDSLSRYAKTSIAKHNSTSVRLGLGSLGKLFESGARKSPVRDLVRSTISTSLGEALVPNKLFPGGVVEACCRAGMLTAMEAAHKLGICPRSLRRLQGRSDTFLVRQNAKGGTTLYDEAAISRLADVLSVSVRPDDCARMLGIPRYCVEAFTLAGLIEAVTEPDAVIVSGVNLISTASISELHHRLEKKSARFDDGATLREAMRRQGDPHDWVAVFEKLLAGRLRLRISPDSGPSLSDVLVVRPADVARHVSRRTMGPGITGISVSCQTAAEIIGASIQFIAEAVRLGIIDGVVVDKRRFALPLEGVLTFQKQYVLKRELCELVGGSHTLISSQLHSAGYQPAASILRNRVWLRSDIEKYIQKRRQGP